VALGDALPEVQMALPGSILRPNAVLAPVHEHQPIGIMMFADIGVSLVADLSWTGLTRQNQQGDPGSGYVVHASRRRQQSHDHTLPVAGAMGLGCAYSR